MEKRLERICDIFETQAGRIDKIESDIEATKSFFVRLEEKSDAILVMQGEILKS